MRRCIAKSRRERKSGVRDFGQAFFVLDGAGESLLDVAKELALTQSLWQSSTFEREEGLRPGLE